MDTKLKKSRPFLVWLCFFLGVNIVVLFAIMGVMGIKSMSDSQYRLNDIKAILVNDFKDSNGFKKKISVRFDELASCIAVKSDGNQAISVTTADEGRYVGRYEEANPSGAASSLDLEGINLIYYAKNRKTGKVVSNSSIEPDFSNGGIVSLPEGYDYYLYFNGKKLFAWKGGKALDVYDDGSGYTRTNLSRFISGYALKEMPGLADCEMILFVKKDSYLYGSSPTTSIYGEYSSFKLDKWIILGFAGIFLLGIGLLVFSFIRRGEKQQFNVFLSRITGWFWLEIKITITIIIFIIFIIFMNAQYWRGGFGILYSILGIAFVAAFCWWCYLMMNDLWFNRRRFFSNNIISSIIKYYRISEGSKPFQKNMLKRVYSLIAVEAILVFLIIFMWMAVFAGGGAAPFIILLILLAAGIYLLYRYIRRFRNTVIDIGKVLDQIDGINNGDLVSRHLLNSNADLYMAEENLNRIQEGVSRGVEEKTRSERLKVELVTNISHDLKTPLTSIISYVDLLSKEEGLPAHVEDYIKILSLKSERLKVLIQDLFDLSKAVSGDMAIDMEKLDLGKLIKQTLADMNEQVEQAGLSFKLNIPDEPVFISSDGSKLYRVFLNLFTNCLKYSLMGSRVYVDLKVNGIKATVAIKNTSNYEMNFDEDEIIERFVRGDAARSTEGSGLGLAIAQNFTHLCGGSFKVKVDGDLFKVLLSFEVQK